MDDENVEPTEGKEIDWPTAVVLLGFFAMVVAIVWLVTQ